MHKTLLNTLETLKTRYDALKKGKSALLAMIEEVELPESVYNSNAIENSTLTLDETEKILLHQVVPPHHSRREIFEATNLAAVSEYLAKKAADKTQVTEELLLLVHRTLLNHINDEIAGRFREKGEYVRVGRHIAPPPEHVLKLIKELLKSYKAEEHHPLERAILFHTEFERIHPFCDGNGRVGRAILNFQLKSHGFPPIIIQNKEKQEYYRSLVEYENDRKTHLFEKIVGSLIKESFHKRITYMQGDEIVPLSDIAKKSSRTLQGITNAAKKQSLPAFRERGRWKVGKNEFMKWDKNSK